MNAYLPEIVNSDVEMTRVSSKAIILTYTFQLAFGFIIGAINVVHPMGPIAFTRFTLSVALIWMTVVAIYGVRKLEGRPPAKALPKGSSVCLSGFRRLSTTLTTIRRDYPDALLVLLAESFYSSATINAIVLASSFLTAKVKMYKRPDASSYGRFDAKIVFAQKQVSATPQAIMNMYFICMVSKPPSFSSFFPLQCPIVALAWGCG